jgi:hypothetical protein
MSKTVGDFFIDRLHQWGVRERDAGGRGAEQVTPAHATPNAATAFSGSVQSIKFRLPFCQIDQTPCVR